MRLLVLAWACHLFPRSLAEGTVSYYMDPSEHLQEMKVYEGENPGPETSYEAVVHLDGQDEPSWEDLHQVASSCFNWLDRNNRLKDIETVGKFPGTALVSGIWIPQDRNIYLATKALGKLKEDMEDPDNREWEAPVWASRAQIGNRNSLIPVRNYHSEDSAYYIMELKRGKAGHALFVPTEETPFKNAKGEESIDIKYPEGAKVVTWGYYNTAKARHKEHGRPIAPCNKDKFGRRSCQKVARSLGVDYATTPDQGQEVAEAAEASDEGLSPVPDEPMGPNPCASDSDEEMRELHEKLFPSRRRRGLKSRLQDRKAKCHVFEPGPINPVILKDWQKPTTGGNAISANPNATSKPTKTEEPPKTTAAPEMPKCTMQDALPDQYSSAFCRCDHSGTTKTLPLMTVKNPKVDTQSCDYTTLPTGTENPVTEETATYTVGGSVCKGVGGMQNENPSSCEQIVPPWAVELSKTKKSIGTSINDDGGDKLADSLVKNLKEHCPEDSEDGCDTESFKVIDVPVIVGGGVEYMTLKANLVSGTYNSTSTRHRMIYGIASGFVKAASKQCKEADYTEALEAGDQGCGDGPVDKKKRNPPPPEEYWDEETGERKLRKRISPGDTNHDVNDKSCKYSADMCTGPELITATVGPVGVADENKIEIKFELVKGEGQEDNPIEEWICEAVVETVGALAMQYMPKIAGFEAVSHVQDIAMEAICGSQSA